MLSAETVQRKPEIIQRSVMVRVFFERFPVMVGGLFQISRAAIQIGQIHQGFSGIAVQRDDALIELFRLFRIARIAERGGEIVENIGVAGIDPRRAG